MTSSTDASGQAARGRVTMAIRVDFLSRPSLSDQSLRSIEWPPHPYRLFSAMTAAHYEAEVGRRETLEWFERLPPPEISAAEIDERTRGSFYVPVNDRIRESFDGRSSLPLADRRVRQERTFAVGSPLPSRSGTVGDPRSVYYVWRGVERPPRDLDDILREVTRLGHSSSMVTASLWSSKTPPPSLVPAPDGDLQLRVPETGTLERLDESHEVRSLPTGRQDQRRPSLQVESWASYSRVLRTAPAESPWLDHWVWTLEPRISVTAWLHLAEAIRGTLLAHLPEVADDVLTGHGVGNHLAVIPLPDVGHRHADAMILGFALLIPEVDDATRSTLLEALAGLRRSGAEGRILAGSAGRFRAELVGPDELRRTLRIETWRGPSRSWATVTPIVLDRFPKRKLPPEAIVADSVERLGLPAPADIVLQRNSDLPGTPASGDFFVRRPTSASEHRGGQRPWSHAVLRWDRPVQGPLVLGAMRHFGLGLCKPLSATGSLEAARKDRGE